jgi:hypothetical protein
MIGAIRSSEKSVFTRATQRNNSEHSTFHSHRRENLKLSTLRLIYTNQTPWLLVRKLTTLTEQLPLVGEFWCQLSRKEGCGVVSAVESPLPFPRPEPQFFHLVAPHLPSRVWVKLVPDPPLIQSGSARNSCTKHYNELIRKINILVNLSGVVCKGRFRICPALALRPPTRSFLFIWCCRFRSQLCSGQAFLAIGSILKCWYP